MANKAEAAVKRTWRQMADRLAERMLNHAYCAQHPVPDPSCPFCDDVLAYREYVEMGGTVSEPQYDGGTVTIGELLGHEQPRSDRNAGPK